MYKLFLMRHGDAESGRNKADLMRALTPRGLREAALQGQRLEDAGVTRIIHSPYKRAVQTAEEVNEFLNLPLDSCADLVPGGDVDRVLDRISGFEDQFLLVCHLPIIADIARELSGMELSFFPATIACFQRRDPVARTAKYTWIKHA